MLRALTAAATAVLLLSVLRGESIPQTTARSLDGQTVTLPNAPSGGATILILGFSHKSDSAVRAWYRQILSAFGADARLAYYEVAEMQGLPGMVKPMVLHGMRKVIKGEEQSRFLVLFTGDNEWRQLAGYADPKEAYVLLVDSTGQLRWHTRGSTADAGMPGLREAVSVLFSNP
jgi:hypothetical protein